MFLTQVYRIAHPYADRGAQHARTAHKRATMSAARWHMHEDEKVKWGKSSRVYAARTE